MGSGGSRTEVIQEPQRPVISGTTFNRNTLMGQTLMANAAQEAANKAFGTFYQNANVGRPADQQYTPMSVGAFDYTSLIPSEESLVQDYDKRIAQEQRQAERREDKKASEKDKYLAGLQKVPGLGFKRNLEA